MIKGIIDTHVHTWDLAKAAYPWLEGDTSILNRTWMLDQLEVQRIQAGITAGVLVQASGNMEDTRLMFDTALQHNWIRGVVAWLPLVDTYQTITILDQELKHEKLFCGVRHQIHDEPDPKWLLQPTVIESLQVLAARDIPFDVVAVLPEHIEAALHVAELVPSLRMMIDHLAQPPISSREKFGRWGDLMKKVSLHRNFYVKVSGLGTASGNYTGRTVDDVRPYVNFVMEHFGSSRICCGGDWPVSVLANDYVATWDWYKDILASIAGESELEKIFFSNAKEFYRLTI